MHHISTTPFGRRPVTSGHLAQIALADAPAHQTSVDKWKVLRDITAARTRFGLSDRTLAVLSALLSFHPDQMLNDGARLIVFPSNQTLSARAHGMAESTLRRHLAALVGAGMILRHDSPNGKRYATDRVGQGGAFGFDLRPLLVRTDEITLAAEEARAEEEALRRQREAVVLRMRDATKLLAYLEESGAGGLTALRESVLWTKGALRRRVCREDLVRMHADLAALLDELKRRCRVVEREEPSGNDAQNERHIQDSNHTYIDRKKCKENLHLDVVTKACPDIQEYQLGGIRHWHELLSVTNLVAPMMGISSHAWADAKHVMGPEAAATTLAAILQKGGAVKSPGGYLRALTDKARSGAFSPGQMIKALLLKEDCPAEAIPRVPKKLDVAPSLFRT